MDAAALLDKLGAEAAALWQERLVWVPVRHHSPACAYALQALLDEVQPSLILIEGPDDCQPLLAQCQDDATQTPVAFFSQKGEGQDLYSAFFPLCAYSPEWVALRAAKQLKAHVQLVDLAYEAREKQTHDDKTESLMAETYLAHSQYLQAIAEQLGCRDHHESWDRLFEQRSAAQLSNWRNFFADVYGYCALARREYDVAVLKASGDHDREVYMAHNIRQALAGSPGKCVVVTGGFHTPALALDLDGLAKQYKKTKTSRHDGRNWLIRYSYDQLDALNGYGAGMPAPAYYQCLWDKLQTRQANPLHDCAADLLVAIAHDNRKQKLTQLISTSDVQAALFQARQLANLRDCPGPGRTEILDAVTSCFVKDSVERNLSVLADARRVLCGDRLGAIPADSRQPPLVLETWQRGQRLGLDFSRTQAKELELEIYKNSKHREISRFFHLLQFCGIGLAGWQAGPDFVSGSQTERVREIWSYSWTPVVESQLLDKITLGTSLTALALRKLTEQERKLEDSGLENRARIAASLLLRACVMGMHGHVGHSAARIRRLIHDDENIASLAGCGSHLLTLSNGQAVLEPDKLDIPLAELSQQCWRNALYRLPHLAETNAADSEKGLQAMQELYAFGRQAGYGLDDFFAALQRLLAASHAPGLIRGAALGLLFQAGQLSQAELEQHLDSFLQAWQDADLVLGLIHGIIGVAREVLWCVPTVLQHINSIMLAWPEAYFLQMLPVLRRLFTQLTPKEIDKVASQLVAANNLKIAPERLYEKVAPFSETELALLQTIDGFVADAMQANTLPPPELDNG